MNYDAVRAELRKHGAIPKRVFVVYPEEKPGDEMSVDGGKTWHPVPAKWRWRLIATRNWSIVGGSQEFFDTRGNAIRAAKKEASFYKVAGVVVL